MTILVLVGFCGLLFLSSRRFEKWSRPFGLWAVLVLIFFIRGFLLSVFWMVASH
jgi:hypothetical protein